VRSAPGGHVIFHDFIDRERNSILKEYATNDRIVASADGSRRLGLLIGTQIIEPLDAVRQAIGWWERLLQEIEADAQKARMASLYPEKRASPNTLD